MHNYKKKKKNYKKKVNMSLDSKLKHKLHNNYCES